MEELLRHEFNEWARAGRGESMERGHRPVGEQAIAQMPVGLDARVLDVGCGSGWATRLLALRAENGQAVGIDISDEMIQLARVASHAFKNVEFYIASAERLPFPDATFSYSFSMESLYYYSDMLGALREIHRVLNPAGLFVTVVDLYDENKASHQWVEQLKVPVHLLSISEYQNLFVEAGFGNVCDSRLYDPAPIPEQYTGTSFRTFDDYKSYRMAGLLLLTGEAMK